MASLNPSPHIHQARIWLALTGLTSILIDSNIGHSASSASLHLARLSCLAALPCKQLLYGKLQATLGKPKLFAIAASAFRQAAAAMGDSLTVCSKDSAPDTIIEGRPKDSLAAVHGPRRRLLQHCMKHASLRALCDDALHERAHCFCIRLPVTRIADQMRLLNLYNDALHQQGHWLHIRHIAVGSTAGLTWTLLCQLILMQQMMTERL